MGFINTLLDLIKLGLYDKILDAYSHAFDQAGWDGEVDTYADLPTASSHSGDVYLVKTSTGILWNKRKGFYISDGSSWGRVSNVTFKALDSEYSISDNDDNSKKLNFELSGITTGNTRTLNIPDNDGTIALTSDLHDSVTVSDSAEIDFTLTGQDITASLKSGSIDESKLDTSVNASLDLADSSLQSGDIGSSIQAYDDGLTSIAGLTTSANKMIYTTALDTYAVTDLTAFARTILDDSDAATVRSTLDVDQAGTDNSTNVTLAGSYDYLTLAGQQITLNQIDLTTDVTGILPDANVADILSIDHLAFNNAYTAPAHTEGLLFYDQDDKTLTMYSDVSNVALQIGQEFWVRIVNKTGGDLSNGDVVYINDAQGNRPTVALADADVVASAGKTIGVVTATISSNAEGYVTTMGLVRGIDTSDWTDGDELWLSTTAGEITNIEPSPPDHAVRIGIALNSTNNGSIYVAVDNGDDLAKLHDTSFSSLASLDMLMYDADNSYWYNVPYYTGIPTYAATLEPTGFDRTDAVALGTISVTDGTLTFNHNTNGGDIEYWRNGKKISKTTNQTASFTDDEGLWYVYYETDDVLTCSQTPWTFSDGKVFVALFYWDATNNKSALGDERHGFMQWQEHEIRHNTEGAVYNTGFAPSLTVDGNGSLDAHCEMQSISAGSIYDEDLKLENLEQTSYEIWYKNGSDADWRWDTADPALVKMAATYPYYNEFTGGAWQLTECSNNSYVLAHLFATNRADDDGKIIIVMGENNYNSSSDAQAGSETEINEITTADFPTAEFVALGTIIIEVKGSYTNSYNAIVISTAEGDDFVDFRTSKATGQGSTPTNHSNLTNLLADDHTQYALLAGRSGGQTLYGGTDAGDDLNIYATSNATKGTINFTALDYSFNINSCSGGITMDSDSYCRMLINPNGNEDNTNGLFIGDGNLYINTYQTPKAIFQSRNAGESVISEIYVSNNLTETRGIAIGYTSGSFSGTKLTGGLSGEHAVLYCNDTGSAGLSIGLNDSGTEKSYLNLETSALTINPNYEDFDVNFYKDTSGTWLEYDAGNDTFKLNASIYKNIIAKSADYIITDTDAIYTILMTTGASDKTITLPTASDNTGRILNIKKVDSDDGNVIIDGEGSETIDGSTTYTITIQYENITIQCDGTTWHIL